MEPIAPELLMALAGGTASAAGQQIWTSLRDLVRRRPPSGEPLGEGALTALAQASDDTARARELADVLALRARQDPAFGPALQSVRREAEAIEPARSRSGDVHNEISGTATIHGTVVQAGDINGPLNLGR